MNGCIRRNMKRKLPRERIEYCRNKTTTGKKNYFILSLYLPLFILESHQGNSTSIVLSNVRFPRTPGPLHALFKLVKLSEFEQCNSNNLEPLSLVWTCYLSDRLEMFFSTFVLLYKLVRTIKKKNNNKDRERKTIK